MAFYKLLAITDTSDWVGRQQHGSRSGSVLDLSIKKGVGDLLLELDDLVAKGHTFNRILFTTHGGPGKISFSGEKIFPESFEQAKVWEGFDKLIPLFGKIYFDGCNVAEGKDGWRFLEAAAKVFLRQSGGMSLGFTSKGFGLWDGFPWGGYAGHTVHPWGHWKMVICGPGAKEFVRISERRELLEAYKKAGWVGLMKRIEELDF